MNDSFPQYSKGQFVYWRRQCGKVVDMVWSSHYQEWEYTVYFDSCNTTIWMGEEELSNYVDGV